MGRFSGGGETSVLVEVEEEGLTTGEEEGSDTEDNAGRARKERARNHQTVPTIRAKAIMMTKKIQAQRGSCI